MRLQHWLLSSINDANQKPIAAKLKMVSVRGKPAPIDEFRGGAKHMFDRRCRTALGVMEPASDAAVYR